MFVGGQGFPGYPIGPPSTGMSTMTNMSNVPSLQTSMGIGTPMGTTSNFSHDDDSTAGHGPIPITHGMQPNMQGQYGFRYMVKLDTSPRNVLFANAWNSLCSRCHPWAARCSPPVKDTRRYLAARWAAPCHTCKAGQIRMACQFSSKTTCPNHPNSFPSSKCSLALRCAVRDLVPVVPCILTLTNR
jgi:hypothetical protein